MLVIFIQSSKLARMASKTSPNRHFKGIFKVTYCYSFTDDAFSKVFPRRHLVLGLESSCDDTGAAVICR